MLTFGPPAQLDGIAAQRRSSISGMRQHRIARRLVLLLCALALSGASLWTTWSSAAHWAPCAGLDWRRMDTACAEAMSTYSQSPIFNLWVVMAGLVIVVVAARIVPRRPGGMAALAAVTLACPLADPGFFWVQWGSADGIPGQGLWTAVLFALATVGLLLPMAATAPWTAASATIPIPREGALGS